MDTLTDVVELKKKLSSITLNDDHLFTFFNLENVIRSNFDNASENFFFNKKVSVLETHWNNQKLSNQFKSVINSNQITLDYSSLKFISNERINFPINELKLDLVIFQDSRSLDLNFRLASDNQTKVNEIGIPIGEQLKKKLGTSKWW